MSAQGALRTLIRHGTFPLIAFGPGLLALGLIEAGGPKLTLTIGVGCAAIIVASYGLLALFERLLPYREDWNQPKRDLAADIVYFVAIGPLSAAVSAWLATALLNAGHRTLPATLALAVWPAHWHPVAQVLLACLVAELGHYCVHRLGHEVPLVWRLHAIHHSARRLYWLNATRFHPIDLLLVAFCQVLPLHLLGIPAPIYVAYVVTASCYGQLQHCNIDLDSRMYGWLFAVPELHRWHHSRRADEGNTNYGAILIVWDLLFRTRFWPGRPIAEPIGIGDMPAFPDGLSDQLLAPFRWARLPRTGSF